MGRVSVEIKARCANPSHVRSVLKSRHASFRGLDRQVDTYFCVPSGRLKLREGDIENALIYYKRKDQKNSKRCDAFLYKGSGGSALKKILGLALGVWGVVEKKREIYFIKNIKFHIDRVKHLGSFLEIEVFGPAKSSAQLTSQCEFFQKLLGVRAGDLVADSYSDQLLRLKTKNKKQKCFCSGL